MQHEELFSPFSLCTITFQPHKLNNVLSEPSSYIHLNFQLQSARTLVPDTWTRVHTGLPVEIRTVSNTWSDKHQTTLIPKYTSKPLSLSLFVCLSLLVVAIDFYQLLAYDYKFGFLSRLSCGTSTSSQFDTVVHLLYVNVSPIGITILFILSENL